MQILRLQASQPSARSAYYKPPPASAMLGTRMPSTIAFGVGLLLFFMPLSEVKCKGQAVASKSGVTYAMGKDWEPVSKSAGLFSKREKYTIDREEEEVDTGILGTSIQKKGNTQYFVIGAMAMALAGLLVSFFKKSGAGVPGIVAGGLAFCCSLALMIDEKRNFTSLLKAEGVGKSGEGDYYDSQPVLAFTAWFYLALPSFLAAAFFCYKRMKTVKT